MCRLPEGICSSLRQDGVKGAADSGAVDHSGRGEGGVRNPEYFLDHFILKYHFHAIRCTYLNVQDNKF